MPEITDLSVSYSRKIQLEQFEPITHHAEATVALNEDDDPDEVFDDVAEQVEDMVERQLASRVAQAKLTEDDE